MKTFLSFLLMTFCLALSGCKNTSSGERRSAVQLENDVFGANADAAREIVHEYIQRTKSWSGAPYALRVGGFLNGLMVVAVDVQRTDGEENYFGSDKNSFVAYVHLSKKSVIQEARGQ